MMKYIKFFKELNKDDVGLVGGKNANLGEMYQKLTASGVRVPNGFAITAEGYDYFIKFNNLEAKIKEILQKTNIYNVSELQKAGEEIRDLIKQGEFPEDLKNEILQAFGELRKEYVNTQTPADNTLTTADYNNVNGCPRNVRDCPSFKKTTMSPEVSVQSAEVRVENNVRGSQCSVSGCPLQEDSQSFATEDKFQVAVRSSATAEDLADASFAGQQETYLNVTERDLLEKVKFCFASLFTDRAIFYRQEKGFDHFKVKLSVGVQKMVRSDLASSGVMFTIDSDSGLDKVIVINGVWGLGELIVQGKVIPDEWIVFKNGLERGFRSIISKRLGEKVKKIVYGKNGGTKEVETNEIEKSTFSLNDDEVLELAKMGYLIEKHYGKAMDIEWAKDGVDGKLYIVQARPETVHSTKKRNVYCEYKLKQRGEIITKGIAIGSKITSGKVRVIKDVSRINEFQEGEILVTEMTDPDWVPIMKIAKGIITDAGGRTSHCAIVSRELGIPAIVGTQNATKILKTGDEVTIDCTGGITGYVYNGLLDYEIVEHDLEKLPETKTKVYVNIGLPDEAWERWYLPVKGVGLAREEFIIAEEIKIHPNALIDYPFDNMGREEGLQEFATEYNVSLGSSSETTQTLLAALARSIRQFGLRLRFGSNIHPQPTRISLPKSCEHSLETRGGEQTDEKVRINSRESSQKFANHESIRKSSQLTEIKQKIDELTKEYEDKKQYFVDKLAEGVAKICTAYYPYEVIVRFSDFKTNEYANLIGGELYEPKEENPMIGWRGASRYYNPKFKEAFELEVLSMKKVRKEMGLDNLVIMVPFCRTPEEGKRVMEIIESIMGKREEKGYKVYVMAEIPSNILQAEEFLEIFDGMSIGSNDLTQLTLGIDRDNEILQSLADERNESVKKLISQVIKICREKNKYIGICGQAPSDFPEIVELLVKEGIESISVNSDVVIKTIEMVKRIEDELK